MTWRNRTLLLSLAFLIRQFIVYKSVGVSAACPLPDAAAESKIAINGSLMAHPRVTAAT